MYVSNWIDAQKTRQEKWEAPLRGGMEAQLPSQNLNIY